MFFLSRQVDPPPETCGADHMITELEDYMNDDEIDLILVGSEFVRAECPGVERARPAAHAGIGETPIGEHDVKKEDSDRGEA